MAYLFSLDEKGIFFAPHRFAGRKHMDKHTGYMKALKCRECGREYPLAATHVCEFDFGPLEVAYDYPKIKEKLKRSEVEKRPQTMWRYRELLPIAGEPTVGFAVGFTPLVKADRLARRLGIRELWIKNDTVNYPTLSFKDRVVSVALSRARELGFTTVACASTGNLANSVAANAASAGLKAYVFIPADLEQGKIVNSLVYGANVIGIKGHYDEVNRLCAEIAGKFGWAFVNVNMRPYYAEGSKSMGFEIAEQLGWKVPQHTVVPMASGSLLTKIQKSYQELGKLGFVEETPYRVHGAQATGCSPISTAHKAGMDIFRARGEFAEKELAEIEGADPGEIFFAWAGSTEPGQGHYYRVQGPAFLLEYDNTQNNANHVHAVWRDLKNDFGEDLLRQHYDESHHENH